MLIEQDFDRRLALSPAVMAEAGRQRLSICKLGDIPQRRLQAHVHTRPSLVHEVCIERVKLRRMKRGKQTTDRVGRRRRNRRNAIIGIVVSY